MKTSILYGRNYTQRASLPAEIPQDKSNHYTRARFMAAHKSRVGTLSGETLIHDPDAIHVGHWAFKLGLVGGRIDACKPFKYDGGICGAVIIPEEYVSRLHDLDEQIGALQDKRREIMAEAAKRGKPLARKDLE